MNDRLYYPPFSLIFQEGIAKIRIILCGNGRDFSLSPKPVFVTLSIAVVVNVLVHYKLLQYRICALYITVPRFPQFVMRFSFPAFFPYEIAREESIIVKSHKQIRRVHCEKSFICKAFRGF